MDIINTIVGLGAAVMMPIIFFVVGLVFRLGIGKSFKAGMTVGVGFVGVNMVINLLLDNLGPASKAMVERLGMHLTVVDVGWPTASTIGWGTPIMVAAVVGFLIINAVMVVLKLTKTVDVDIFNYWIFLQVGATVYAVTNNFWFSTVFVWVVFAIVLKVADLAAPYIQKEYNIKGISFPHLAGLMWSPVAIGVNWVVDRIPGLKKVDFNAEKIQKRFGAFGEPVVLGFILGLIIGVLAGYSPDKAITLAINVAAAMVLLPKMIDVLLEGLITVRDAAEIQLKKWFPKREFFIGMDTALLIGEPSVLASGLLLIPIAIVLALILPGNKMLPFADLASLTFLLALVTPFVRRNMFKMLITGTLSIIVILYVGSAIAPFVTQSAVASNIKLPSDFTGISNMTGAVSGWVGWLGVKAGELFNMVF
ncbi:PTS galactitol transporter subunit IIC [Bifidobacterium psychraerophilum]|jgi:PTS system galactitol-specific IIC component|uniref:PTS galactitol-specific enzyme IIC n=1 Tax=Bifidobacterium psychraerophilum TaxID=218140 RepID=A0A087CI53_9BIFI|nr:PTS transporter subunit IIC [Bifidobacterium psychraerophilum]KFI82953.1 PTS galactitol-specific enzyme IIC [Bifidobacterium psychraerophilum]MCI1803784.1 PTS galactitol transporter subunit IIC [Bifidobacterium psychraerophilum]MCI2176208.1 PTS galactitol transporter subunit IIC [Bifidobacterium psychraerophilum]MCI2181318.1 PTS galactitol transporter subunit IIC [Bifidobacterium psychraerophilum]PKA94701.1 PTS system galactitol-specific IIC component [Bifidobacterium psychraerophilum DSM 2